MEETPLQASRISIVEENAYMSGRAEPLRARERAILSLVGQQWTSRRIAGELILAHSTVRRYPRQIYAKRSAVRECRGWRSCDSGCAFGVERQDMMA